MIISYLKGSHVLEKERLPSLFLGFSVLPLLFSSASAQSVFFSSSFFYSLQQRGQLLIPDKCLAFGATRGRERWERGEGGGARGREGGGSRWGAAHRSRRARSEGGSEGLKSRGGGGHCGRRGGGAGREGRKDEV